MSGEQILKSLIQEEETLTDVNTQGGFVEVIYAPKGDMSKWYMTGLLNLVDSAD